MGCSDATYFLCHFCQADSPNVCCFEVLGYERRSSDTFQFLGGSLFFDRPRDRGEVFGFPHRGDQIYVITNWHCWSRDLDFKCLMHAQEWKLLALWHNVELFVVSLMERTRFFAKLPSRWERTGCCDIFTVPVPTARSYFPNLVFNRCPSVDSVGHLAALKSI